VESPRQPSGPARKGLLRSFWRLAKPYWFSEEAGSAWSLLSLVVGLSLASVYLLVQFNTWNQAFYDAVQKFDEPAFWTLMLRFCLLAAGFIFVGVFNQYFSLILQNRWRRWMTRRLLDRWLDDKSHYLWHLADARTDNPDQRIAEDVRDFVQQSLDLSVGLLNQIVTLASFIAILWTLSGPLAIPLGSGHSFSLPGYMAWVCLAYAVTGTWLSHRIGKPLIHINYAQQQTEADFRFGLVRLRENAESVALSDGEKAERHSLRGLFDLVYANFQALLRKQMHLNFFSIGYDQIATVFPYLVAAPRYFSKQITLGGLFQIANAFSQVKDALSWAVANYPTLAFWRAVVERLEGFEDEIVRTKDMRTRALAVLGSSPAGGSVHLEALSLSLPGQDAPLTAPLNLDFPAGRSVLISGPSGCGKSTLLRAVHGVWPFSQGRVLLPQNESRMVFPQKPYLPIGSLRAALAYPSEADAVPDSEIQAVLGLCRLEHLREHLDQVESWSLILSVGEQQRVAWARVFLQKPRWLFLDEATSALDEATQQRLYQALETQLPETTMISVAHSQNPRQHHQGVWDFGH